MESDEGLVPDTVGPIGIILAPSSVEVERISKLSRRFLHGSPTKIGIVESYGVRNTEKTTVSSDYFTRDAISFKYFYKNSQCL